MILAALVALLNVPMVSTAPFLRRLSVASSTRLGHVNRDQMFVPNSTTLCVDVTGKHTETLAPLPRRGSQSSHQGNVQLLPSLSKPLSSLGMGPRGPSVAAFLGDGVPAGSTALSPPRRGAVPAIKLAPAPPGRRRALYNTTRCVDVMALRLGTRASQLLVERAFVPLARAKEPLQQ